MKTSNIIIRCTEDQKRRLGEMAEAAEMSLSAFILWSTIPELDSTGGLEGDREVKVKPPTRPAIKKPPVPIAIPEAKDRINSMADLQRERFLNAQGLKKYK